MEFTFHTFVLLPIGLGLLGFVEPCSIGGHLLFLETQRGRSNAEKTHSVLVFIAARTLVSGLFGAFIAFVGQRLVIVQTTAWLLFGIVYLTIGLAYLIRRAGALKKPIILAPNAWKQVRNPLVLGLAFGLNIPACAAPIMFGLLGLAGSSGTATAGFLMMAVFGFSLSLPLAAAAASPSVAAWLDNLGAKFKQMHYLVSFVFVLLGGWSIWFGLNVDPAKWAG